MPQMINISIPDVIANNYTNNDKLQRGLYEDIIISEFQKGNLSIRECTELLDITYENFLEFLGERKLSFITETKDELEKSYASFERFTETYKKS